MRLIKKSAVVLGLTLSLLSNAFAQTVRECKKICVSGILNNLLKGNWNANYRPNPRSTSCRL